jgi:TonB family protein
MMRGLFLGRPGRHLFAVAVCGALVALHPQGPVSAQGHATGPVQVSAFRDPSLEPQSYPTVQPPSGELYGWVDLALMVDRKGKPFEIGIVRSSGSKRLEERVMEAWNQVTFRPATRNGEPVESLYETSVTVNGSPPGAQPEFASAYSALQAAISANKRAAADAAMQEMIVTTLYEDASYGFAQYRYASRWGDDTQRENAILHALGLAWALAPEQRRAVLLANLNLQSQRHDYFEALQMWSRVRKDGIDRETAAKVTPLIEQVERVRTQTGAYTMSGSLDDSGVWSTHLLKRNFRVEALPGTISRVKLRCKGGFASFELDPTLPYDVPERYEDCRLSLEGTPGTALTLTQS